MESTLKIDVDEEYKTLNIELTKDEEPFSSGNNYKFIYVYPRIESVSSSYERYS